MMKGLKIISPEGLAENPDGKYFILTDGLTRRLNTVTMKAVLVLTRLNENTSITLN
jgi:hypothetical protein